MSKQTWGSAGWTQLSVFSKMELCPKIAEKRTELRFRPADTGYHQIRGYFEGLSPGLTYGVYIPSKFKMFSRNSMKVAVAVTLEADLSLTELEARDTVAIYAKGCVGIHKEV